MRQRKIKDIEQKLAVYEPMLVREPAAQKGKWRGLFSCAETETAGPATPERGAETGRPEAADAGPADRRRLYLEIGCGKGQFITAQASRDPDGYYLAAEGLASVIYRAVVKVAGMQLGNVRFLPSYIREMTDWFTPGELDGIFLNFSDPWPKDRNYKRRLTYEGRLRQYAAALAPGSFIRFKTDNDALFAFTEEQVRLCAEEAGLAVRALTHDLHASPYAGASPATEYEDKFAAAGKKIHYLELVKAAENPCGTAQGML